eukprot:m.64727 g.64727  ORF g.64727 m.64727 type:complete len:653 (+) comp12026_c0_seq2:277-2235(+)
MEEEDKGKVVIAAPVHPLPDTIQSMAKEDTVCRFCGISYLIHREVKQLQERVEFLEKQLSEFKQDAAMANEYKLQARKASEELQAIKTEQSSHRAQQTKSIQLVGTVGSQLRVQLSHLRTGLRQLKDDVSGMHGLTFGGDAMNRLTGELRLICDAQTRALKQKQTLEQMNSELNDTIVQLRRDTQGKGQLEGQLRTASKDLEDVKHQLSQLQEQLKAATDGNHTLKQKLQDETQSLETMRTLHQSELDRLKTQLTDVRTQFEQSKAECKATAAQSESTARHLAQLEAACQRSETTVKEQQHTLDEQQAQLKAASNALLEEQQALLLAQQSQQAAEQQTTQLQKKTEKQEILITQLQAKLAEAQAEVEQYLSTSKGREESEQAHIEKVEALSLQLQQCKAEEAKLTSIVKELKQNAAEMDKTHSEQISLYEAKHHNLEQQIAVLHLEAQKQEEARQSEVSELEAALKVARIKIEALQKDNEQKREEVNTLQVRLQMACTTIDDKAAPSQSEVEKMRSTLAEQKTEILRLHETIASECIERQNLVEALEKARESALHQQRSVLLSGASSTQSGHARSPGLGPRGEVRRASSSSVASTASTKAQRVAPATRARSTPATRATAVAPLSSSLTEEERYLQGRMAVGQAHIRKARYRK